MLKNKTKRQKIWILLWFIAYVLCVGVLVYESAQPGKVSAEHSNQVGGSLADLINGGAGDQTVKVEPTGLNIKNKITEASVGDTYKLEIETIPSDSSYKSYIYESSDETIATVNEQGEIEFLKQGEVDILVKNKDYNKINQTFRVNVLSVLLESIEASIVSSDHEVMYENEIYSLYINNYYYIDTILYPSNATNKEVSYEINNNEFISIDNNKITTKKVSDDIITKITITSGSIKEEIKVKVIEDKSNEIALEEISLSKEEIELPVGYSLNFAKTSLFKISFSPSDTTFQDFKIEISETNLISLNNKTIKTKDIGEVTIKVISTYDSNIYDELKLIIKEIPVTSFKVSIDGQYDEVTLPFDSKANVELKSISPSIASIKYNKDVDYFDYEVEDESILTVNDKGVITTLSSGTTTIKVKIYNYDSASPTFIYEEIKVTVLEALKFNDFEITSLLKEFNEDVIISNKTYEDVSSLISIDKFTLDNVEVNENISKNFTLEFKTSNSKITYTYKNDDLKVKASKSGYIYVSVVHESGVTKTKKVLVIGDFSLEDNSLKINDSKEFIIESSTSQSYAISLLDGYEDYVDIVNNNSSLITLFGKNEGSVKLSVKPICEDIVLDEFEEVYTINITHKLVEDFIINLTNQKTNEEVVIDNEIANVHINDVVVIDELFIPYDDPTKYNISYSLSNKNIASIDNNEVKFDRVGTTILTVKEIVSGITKEVTFNVSNVIKLKDKAFDISQDGLKYDESNNTYKLKNGVSANIKTNFTSSSTYTEVSYSSSDTKILTVGNDGVITPKSVGKATITASIDDGFGNVVGYEVKVEVTGLDLIEDLQSFFYKVRKGLGHFTAFLVLGIASSFFLMMFFDKKRWFFVVPLNFIQGFFVAGLTEFIQLNVEGRSGLMSDVWLDFSGFSTSTIIISVAFIVIEVIKYILRKNKISKGD